MYSLIQFANQFSPEFIWLLQLVFCYGAMLLLLYLFGRAGLYMYIAVSIVAANIEVLKLVQFHFFPDPVALGTIQFCALFLATDILTEYYGAAAARLGIKLGFAAMVLMAGSMLLTLSFTPLSATQAAATHVSDALATQDHIYALFAPAPALLAATLIAYLISQYSDVWIFSRIRATTGRRLLWLRKNVSTLLASLLDNIVFSVLAWKVFAVHQVDWHALWFTYIFGTYVLRVVVSLLDTPVIYLARYMLPRPEREVKWA